MQYNQISDEQAKQQTKGDFLWEKGDYDFTIIQDISMGTKTYSTSEYTKENGNNILRLCLKVFSKDGSDRTQHILDHIVTNFEGMEFKLRHLADTCGLLNKYDSGKLVAEDFIGRSGKCKLGIQKGSQKDDGTFYNDKNVIADYIKKDSSLKDDLNDDLPDFMA